MSTPPTRAEIEALIALAEKATPGPWTPRGAEAAPDGVLLSAGILWSRDPDLDAEFIAAARNLLPALARAYLDLLDRQAETIAGARAEERERCIHAAEKFDVDRRRVGGEDWQGGYATGRTDAANAIRALGDDTKEPR